MDVNGDVIEEGLEYSVKIDAKDARGEGIGRVGNFVVLVRDAKTRIGNIYKIRITKVHRTFAYGELQGAARLIGGSRIEL
jgi:predicted RNA-binding protein with TRAM domain